MTWYTTLRTETMGDLLLVASASHLVGVYFMDCAHAPGIGDDWRREADHPVLRQAAVEIEEYLGGRRAAFTVPLQPRGTAFQQKTWWEIAGIPFGETITYSDLAGKIERPTAIRAAASATARNPLAIIIPCHRIVAKNGAVHRYAGGANRKSHLLAMERSTARG